MNHLRRLVISGFWLALVEPQDDPAPIMMSWNQLKSDGMSETIITRQLTLTPKDPFFFLKNEISNLGPGFFWKVGNGVLFFRLRRC